MTNHDLLQQLIKEINELNTYSTEISYLYSETVLIKTDVIDLLLNKLDEEE